MAKIKKTPIVVKVDNTPENTITSNIVVKENKPETDFARFERCLIVSDLDGTLLDGDSKISKYSEEVIKQISKKGHIFCICTGRPYRASYMYYDQLDLNTIIANYNGTSISHPRDMEFRPIQFTFKKELIIGMLSNPKINALISNALIENNRGSFFLRKSKNTKEMTAMLQQFHVEKNAQLRFIDGNFDVLIGDAFAVILSLPDNNGDKVNDLVYLLKKYIFTLTVRVKSVKHGGVALEVNSNFGSKGTALHYLACYYGIPFERCYVFGDGDNDTEMLSMAGNGYAMRNGTTTAKLSSRLLTKYSNKDDGVAYELAKIFKLPQVKFDINEKNNKK